MREFIIKTLIVAGITGAWAGLTISEFGPVFEKKSRAVKIEPPPVMDSSPPGRFGTEPGPAGGSDENP